MRPTAPEQDILDAYRAISQRMRPACTNEWNGMEWNGMEWNGSPPLRRYDRDQCLMGKATKPQIRQFVPRQPLMPLMFPGRWSCIAPGASGC